MPHSKRQFIEFRNVVPLLPLELERCEEIANMRIKANAKYKLTNRTHLQGDQLTIDMNAAKGEYACCKLWGVDYKQLLTDGGGHADSDLILSNGWSVEVKTPTRRGYMLSFEQGKTATDVKADVLALVWPTAAADCMDVRGVVSRARFIKEAKLRTFRDGPQLSFEHERMSPPLSMKLPYNVWPTANAPAVD